MAVKRSWEERTINGVRQIQRDPRFRPTTSSLPTRTRATSPSRVLRVRRGESETEENKNKRALDVPHGGETKTVSLIGSFMYEFLQVDWATFLTYSLKME